MVGSGERLDLSSGRPNWRGVIVVATANFEIYHDVVGELRDRGVSFTTIDPDDALPVETTVVITGPGERDRLAASDVVVAEPDAPRRAVEAALAVLRGDDGRTVVGVDPGRKPGIAVLSGDVVVAAFQVPANDAADVVRDAIRDAVDPIVRVGDGARREGATIVDGLENVRVELVDETGTTPSLGTGARGMGDVLAAVNIARLSGDPVDSRSFEPTEGEIQRVKARSRERSSDNRAIDTELARQVARGDLDVDDALRRHRNREASDSTSDDTERPEADRVPDAVRATDDEDVPEDDARAEDEEGDAN